MEIMLWVVSVVAASAFFGAGLLWSRWRARESTEDAAQAPSQIDLRRLDRHALVGRCQVAERERARLAQECDRLAAHAAMQLADAEAVDKEAARLRARSDAMRATLGRRRVELAGVRAALAAAQRRPAELDREMRLLLQRAMTAESDAERLRAAQAVQRKTHKDVRDARDRGVELERERASLDARLAELRKLESAQEEHLREGARWKEQLGALEARLANATSAEVARTLRHDLALANEMVRAHDQRAERLGEENVALRQEVDELSAQLPELERLRAENAELRAQGLGGGKPEGVALRPLQVVLPPDGLAHGGTFQTLVDRIGDVSEVRSAVVADELGLVVACHGEHGDELAALGALFVRAGAQARHLLPLREVSRLTLEDEQSVSVTVTPLRPGALVPSGARLALIMLAVGAKPDTRQITRLLGSADGQ
jgi:hypothetical protein